MDVAGDVIAAGTTLAGLVLVFLGSNASSFGNYNAAQQGSVKTYYQVRAWFAFGEFVISLAAAVLGLIAKWFTSVGAAYWSPIVLLVAFAAAIIAALLSVLEIK